MSEDDVIIPPVEVDDSDDGASASEDEDQPGHPWPHLNKYFVFKRADKANNAVFTCVMCQPKVVEIKGHISSLSNLKRHVKRVHYAMHTQVGLLTQY